MIPWRYQEPYLKCSRCGTKRPPIALVSDLASSAAYLHWLAHGGVEPDVKWVCFDTVWCEKLVEQKQKRRGKKK